MLHDGHLDGRASSIVYERNIFEKYHTRICAINSKPVTETEHEKRFVDSTTNINFLKDSHSLTHSLRTNESTV